MTSRDLRVFLSQETVLLLFLPFHKNEKLIYEKRNVKYFDIFVRVRVCGQRPFRFYPAAHSHSVHCRLQYEESQVRRAETERDNISDGPTGVCRIFCCGNKNVLAAVL